MKKPLLLALLLATAATVPAKADFVGSESFSGTYQDVLKWDSPFSGGQAYLSQTGGVLKFVNPDATSEGFMAWPWAIEGDFDSSWAVQVDVNMPMIPLADGNTAVGMGIGVRNGQDEEDFLGMSLEHVRSTGQPQKFAYTAALDINGTSTETSVPASATLGAVRIVWNADTQILATQYDPDGPTNGYAWTTLSIFDPVNAGWDMDSSNTFEILVAGYSELTSVAAAKNVYADNFKVESLGPRNLLGGSTFTDGTSNTIQFGEDRGINATLTQSGGRLAYEQSAAGEGTATCPWLPNTGSFTEDWEATVDLHVDDFAAADGAVRMGLYVEAGGSVAGVRFGLEKNGGTPTRRFTWEDASPGGASGSANAALADGSVRFVFDSTDKTLNCYYDDNGNADGYSWILLGSLDIDDPSSDWGLTNDSRFHIWLSGESDTPVTPANAWADNFRCVSDFIPPFISTPTGFEDFSGIGKSAPQWSDQDLIVGNATLSQIGDGSVRTISVAEEESTRAWFWQSNGSFGSSWSVQADLNVPYVELAPGSTSAGMGIAVVNSADPTDRFNVGLENNRSEGQPQTFHFLSGLDINGTDSETMAPAFSAIGAVRIAWNHTTKQLTAAYDPDGAANGYSWTVFRTFSPAGAANWNMTASHSFRIALYGSAEETALTANHGLYADNFAVFGSTTTLLPVVKTSAATPPFSYGATLNGSVNAKGFPRAVYFDWGTTTAYGSSMPADTAIADGTSNTLFFGEVTGLQPHTKYNFRIRATGSLGTANGANMTFTTANSIPVGVADNIHVLPGAAAILPILTNDTDADGDVLTLLSNTALSPAAAGKLSKSGANLVFTAAANFSAPATFTYIAKDAFGGKSAATTVTLTPAGATLDFTETFPLAAAGNVAVGGYDMTINTTGAWSVVEKLTWVSTSATSGTGTQTIKIIVQPNNSLSSRTGVITIAGQPHTITQNAVGAAVISLLSPPDPALVGAPYLLALNVDNAPVVFTVKNLPPGLTLNPVTAEITGTPTKAGSYDVTIKAKNAAGDAVTTDIPAATTLAFTIVVDHLRDAFIGVFHGMIFPDAEHNGNLGSRLELTITSTGAITGKVITGTASQAVKGQLVVDQVDPEHPAAVIEVPNKNKLPWVLELFFDHDTESLYGFFGEQGSFDAAPVLAWRNPWSATNKATEFAGLHTFSLDQPLGNPLVPQGAGFGSFKPNETTGAVTVAGKLPDGSSFTTGTFVGPEGQVLVYAPLYSNKGVLFGDVDIIVNGAGTADNDVYCQLEWFKPAAATTAKDPVYPWGIDSIPIIANGGSYGGIAPGGVVMGLDGAVANNATLLVGGGALGDLVDFSINASVTNPSATGLTNKVTFPAGVDNPNAVKITKLDPATGAFTGEFTLFGATTALNRKVPFQGQIVKSPYWGVVGLGYALVPEPIVPPFTAATALRYSVPIVFMPATAAP